MEDPCILSGILEKIIFRNEENGYSIVLLELDKTARETLKDEELVDNVKKTLICVGSLLEAKPFAHLQLTGTFTRHPRYGLQFAFTKSEEILPSTTEGISLFLTSGIIEGLGEKTAERIVKAFGQDTFTILDQDPKRLFSIPGISQKTCEKIVSSWAAHTLQRNLMLFLQPFGISIAKTSFILHKFGPDALEQIKTNPYLLCLEVPDISFHTADAIAATLNLAKDNPMRQKAYLITLLYQAAGHGHLYQYKNCLEENLSRLLNSTSWQMGQSKENTAESEEDWSEDIRDEAEGYPEQTEQHYAEIFQSLENEERIVCEDLTDDFGTEHTAVYLSQYYHYENKIAEYILNILCAPKSISLRNPKALASDIIQKEALVLAAEQCEAVLMAAESKILVITGGPGTGKTTIIKAIIRLFATQKARIELAAPTGRAARRMQEATGYAAKTIHRLLKFSASGNICEYDESNPIACDVLIIDEASMMDVSIFYHLLCAVPLGATLIIVGDIFQLPSVGPGMVLSDIIGSGVVPVVKLARIFRQSAESAIVRYAHMINEGEIPPFKNDQQKRTDFYFIEENDPQLVAQTISDLVSLRLPAYYHFAVQDIQVLSPMRKGDCGVLALNRRLQDALNPQKIKVQRQSGEYRLYDKVMQIRNDYEKEVFNGDIGTIVDLDLKARKLTVQFDDLMADYDFSELDALITAYAISIHKSQGSEYPAVIIPLVLEHRWMLQRNLLYTGVTRGKQLVVLIGERQALFHAIENTKTILRMSSLKTRIRQLAEAVRT
ncbi:MAG: ATP-dependent RecD-like DNA helicase [Desulfovibrio sp.]|nr:ATP-dependent RecD-like DNA helicase [Desulfovibrio sp.]